MKGFVADTIAFSNVDGLGNRFVVFLQGCNFVCVACHNPQTIPAATGEHFAIEIDALLASIRRAAPFLSGVTVSGGEATQQTPFVHALFSAIKTDPDLSHLTCFVDSNGACDPETWTSLSSVMDGAMIDLKCLDPRIHQQMTGQTNDDVRASIEQLQRLGLLYEVRLLILAGVNDDPDLIDRTGQWLATIDPTMRVKVIGFRSHGARPHTPALVEPDPQALEAIASQLRSAAAFDVCVI